MPPPDYIERVSAWLQNELGHAIQSALRDPRLGMVSVTGLRLSRDQRHAEVFVTVIGCDDAQQATEPLAALNGASGYLQSRLAATGRLRIVPQLRFCYDPGVEQGRRIDALLKRTSSAPRTGPSAKKQSP